MELSPPAIAVYRFGMFFVALTIWLKLRGRPFTLAALRTSFPGGLALAFDVFLYFYAVKHTSITNATLIGALQPALIMAISMPLFGERPSRRDVIAAGVAIAGVAAVVVIASGQPSWSGIGDLAAVGAMFSWGTYFIASRRAQETLGSTEYTAGVSFWAAALNVPVALVSAKGLSLPVADDWPLLLFMTFGVGLLGSSMMNWSISKVQLWLASTMTLIIPMVAAVLAWWLLDEALTAPQVAAMAVVLGALAVIVIGQSRTQSINEPAPAVS
jgi:drug/metabolite transporter (DMT)-like permease